MTQEEKMVHLTVAEAMAMIPEGDVVHTFMNPSGMLLGADWSREELLAALQGAKTIELAGETATNIGHGLAFWRDGKPIFVETRKKKK